MNKKKLADILGRVGSRAADIVTVAAGHPASLALIIMAAAVPLKLALAGDESTPQKQRIGHELGGLYVGAQGSLVALAAAPVITQGLQTLTALKTASKP